MKFCVLASGSKGNMTYIETKEARILLDAGISLVDAKNRCPEIDFSGITDIFITHEHGDHIRFLRTIMKKTDANLYIHKKVFRRLDRATKEELAGHAVSFIEEDSHYEFKGFDILTLGLSHDSIVNLGYIFISDGVKLAYVTDTGFFPEQYIEAIKSTDALIIEANHSVEALIESNRDWSLKERILSVKGHMSNQDCYKLLEKVICHINNSIVLAHVSEDCNSDDALYEEIISKLEGEYEGEILIARQKEAIKMIEI